MFSRLYAHYKHDWDMEMRLWHANMTYEEAWIKSQQDQLWIK